MENLFTNRKLLIIVSLAFLALFVLLISLGRRSPIEERLILTAVEPTNASVINDPLPIIKFTFNKDLARFLDDAAIVTFSPSTPFKKQINGSQIIITPEQKLVTDEDYSVVITNIVATDGAINES